MSLQLVAASSQYLINSAPPVTATPWTAAYWLKTPTGTVDQVPWNLINTGADDNYWSMYKNNAGTLFFQCQGGATYTEVGSTTALISNAWTYIVYRAISATNRRGSLLHANGVIDNVQNTTSVTPSGINALGIGQYVGLAPGAPLDGSIAEFALWNADVQADGGQLLDSTLRQMAYGGPFSLTHMLGKIVDYQSFKTGLTSDRARAGEVFNGAGFNRQVWTAVNAPALGPHVQLPATYMKPPGLVPRALVL